MASPLAICDAWGITWQSRREKGKPVEYIPVLPSHWTVDDKSAWLKWIDTACRDFYGHKCSCRDAIRAELMSRDTQPAIGAQHDE